VTSVAEIILLRHGEVASYFGDHGLTDRGIRQARAEGERLADLIGDGPTGLRHAPNARAAETAAEVAAALRAKGAELSGPIVDHGFDNFRVALEDGVTLHEQMLPAVAAKREGGGGEPVPAWAAEMGRFADLQDSGDDPITWWLTNPTLTIEPAAVVVRRFWRAMTALADHSHSRTVVCTHSGPIRALAAQAFGHDPGEPRHLEALVVRLSSPRAGSVAELTYRGEKLLMAVPELGEPAW
jgi:broad specificity phosphatase PhoE